MLRLKQAALLALLEGRFHVDPEDWILAATMRAVSHAVRASVVEVVPAVEVEQEKRTSRKLAARQVDADEARAIAERKRRVLVAAEKLAVKVWNADEEMTKCPPDGDAVVPGGLRGGPCPRPLGGLGRGGRGAGPRSAKVRPALRGTASVWGGGDGGSTPYARRETAVSG